MKYMMSEIKNLKEKKENKDKEYKIIEDVRYEFMDTKVIITYVYDDIGELTNIDVACNYFDIEDCMDCENIDCLIILNIISQNTNIITDEELIIGEPFHISEDFEDYGEITIKGTIISSKIIEVKENKTIFEITY